MTRRLRNNVPLDFRCEDCGQPPGQRCRGPDGEELRHPHLKRKDTAAHANLRRRFTPPQPGAGTALVLAAVGVVGAVNPHWYR